MILEEGYKKQRQRSGKVKSIFANRSVYQMGLTEASHKRGLFLFSAFAIHDAGGDKRASS
jgi:hypothetical protein